MVAKTDPFTTEEHWKLFYEFCYWELKAGGPDPHMKLSIEMSRGQSLEEQLWRAGCYIAVYNAPFGEAIWRNWSWSRINKEPEYLYPWLVDNWKKIVTRRERRCVRKPLWMNDYLHGYAEFVRQYPKLLEATKGLSKFERYERLSEGALEVPRLGRYVALKLMEFLIELCGADAELPDLRPKGGWSPREMLSVLWPEHKEVGLRDDRQELLDLTNQVAEKTRQRLIKEYNLELSMFDLQVLLCDYKQSWKSMRQYPGRSIDSELAYCREAEKLWGFKSEVWEARKKLFLPQNLGELQGWEGPREECAQALRTYKYTWTDTNYNFMATKDFSRPAPRISTIGPKPEGLGRIHPILEGRLYQSCSWAKFSVEQRKAIVNYLGITGIVTLWKGEPDHSEIVDWFCASPIPDGKVVSKEVENVAAQVRSHLDNGGRIVVMCHAGRNRSGLISALTVRGLLRCSGEKAVELVRAKRPRAIANEAFETYITGLPVLPAKGLLF